MGGDCKLQSSPSRALTRDSGYTVHGRGLWDLHQQLQACRGSPSTEADVRDERAVLVEKGGKATADQPTSRASANP
jgi:hypothetical protein